MTPNPAETEHLIRTHLDRGTITTREHEALHLRFVSGLSTRQIAAALDVNRSTVRDRIHNALAKIDRKERAA